MDIDRINCAVIAATDLILKNVERTILPTAVPLKGIRAALVPLIGIQWRKQVICGLTTNRFDDILKNLRNRGIDATTYDKLTALRQDAFAVPTAQPTEWLLWVPLIHRCRLQGRFPWPTLYETIPILHQKGYSSPENLAILPDSVSESTFSDTPRLSEARSLLGSARAVFSKQANGEFRPSSTLCFSSDTFASAVKAASKKAKLDSVALTHDACPFNLEPTFNKLGPPAKLTLLKKRNPPPGAFPSEYRSGAA